MDILLEGGAALAKRDYTLMIDQSASMMIKDSSEDQPRWEAIQASTLALATRCEQLDPNGITIYLFADQFQRYENVTSAKVAEIFQTHQPSGTANLAVVLQDALNQYFDRRARETLQPNGETIVIVTGGETDHNQALREMIINAANQLTEPTELGIELIQVGANSAVRKLFKALDHDLKSSGAKYDICNTITFEAMAESNLSEVLLSAVFGA
ncbi:MAG: hypothetical protein ACFBSC_20400 [Microcoleaceae cyanobacterium]